MTCRLFGQFLHPLCPENKMLVQMQEKLYNKLNHSVLSAIFNETCIIKTLMNCYYQWKDDFRAYIVWEEKMSYSEE